MLGCDSASEEPTDLPNVTHMHFIADPDAVRPPDFAPLQATRGLTRCMTVASYAPLTHILIQGYGMTTAVWNALPACLQHLDCTMSVPLQTSRSLLKLRSLRLHQWDNIFALSTLVTYLKLVPQCEQLELVNRPGYIHVSDSRPYVCASDLSRPSSLDDLVVLHNLVSNGLEVLPHGLNLHLRCDYSRHGTSTSFLSRVPTLTSVRSILLDCTLSTVQVMVPENLSAKCPHITSFGLIGRTVATMEELKHLTHCGSLQHVSLACLEEPSVSDPTSSYSTEAILMLCASLASLRVLQLQERDLEGGASVGYIQSQLHVTGSLAEIRVYTDPRALQKWVGVIISID